MRILGKPSKFARFGMAVSDEDGTVVWEPSSGNRTARRGTRVGSSSAIGGWRGPRTARGASEYRSREPAGDALKKEFTGA